MFFLQIFLYYTCGEYTNITNGYYVATMMATHHFKLKSDELECTIQSWESGQLLFQLYR